MYKVVFLFGFFLFSACQNTPEQATQKQTQVTYQSQLSPDDRKALGEATGRSVEFLSIDSLNHLLWNTKGSLHIFCLWKLYNDESKVMVRNLRDAQREIGVDQFKVVYVNLDQTSLITEINAFVRELGILDDIYIVSEPSEGKLMIDAKSRWNDQLPTMVLVNESEGTRLMYQQLMGFEELLAVLQPLLI